MFTIKFKQEKNVGNIERINKILFSEHTDNGMLQIFSFLLNNYIELF